MSTLAAEGNPKENEIVIAAGDVLSTAQLDVDFRFFGSQGPNIPPPVEALTFSSYTCGDVFDWPGKEEGQDWIYLRGDGSNTTDSLEDKSLDLTILSSPGCYGVLWQKHYGNTFDPDNANLGGGDVLWETMFNGVVDGTPRAGPCNWIGDATTHAVAILYALIVNVDTGLTELRSWSSASLKSVDNSTLLGTMRLPVIGESLLLEAIQFDGGGINGMYGFIYDANGAQQATVSSLFEDVQTFSASTARHAKLGVGFVSIGGLTAGRMKFFARRSGAALVIHNS